MHTVSSKNSSTALIYLLITNGYKPELIDFDKAIYDFMYKLNNFICTTHV